MRIGINIWTKRVWSRLPAASSAVFQDNFGRNPAAPSAAPVVNALNAYPKLVSQSLGASRVLNVDFKSFHAEKLIPCV